MCRIICRRTRALVLAWFKKGSGSVVRSTGPNFGRCPAVPATVADAFLNHALFLLVCTALCGCGVEYYESETTLYSDGSVERAVYQPQSKTPKAAQDRRLWEQVTYASEICLEERGQSIRELPPAAPDKDHDYFAAWGRFASADKIPDYFTLSIPDGSKAGRLQRQSSRIDHVFVIEHRWEETLTDIVTFADMRTARPGPRSGLPSGTR